MVPILPNVPSTHARAGSQGGACGFNGEGFGAFGGYIIKLDPAYRGIRPSQEKAEENLERHKRGAFVTLDSVI